MTLRSDSSAIQAHAQVHGHAAAAAAARLLRARRIVLYLLLALGSCTIITAILLAVETLDDINVTYRQISKQQQARTWTSRAAANGMTPAGTALLKRRQGSEEQDPDWVNSTAAAVKFMVKECAPGCEVRGNCNAEEGR
jgi:hypothetical protein